MKRERPNDRFYSGMCAALAVCYSHDDPTSTLICEIVRSANPKEMLSFARRTKDMVLPDLRKTVAYLERLSAPL